VIDFMQLLEYDNIRLWDPHASLTRDAVVTICLAQLCSFLVARFGKRMLFHAAIGQRYRQF
jgi:hypothetical protein